MRLFSTNVDSDGPFHEQEIVHRYDHILSPNEQERLARWAWHAQPNDTYDVGKITITCVKEDPK